MPSSFFSRRSTSYSPVPVANEEDDGNGGIQLQSAQHNNSDYDDYDDIIIEEEGELPGVFRIDDDDDDDIIIHDLEGQQQQHQVSSSFSSYYCCHPSYQPSLSTSSSDNSNNSSPTVIPPSNYICPLTLQVMNEPVNDGCGHCFERDAIISWLEYHEICPISRKPLHISRLHPADALSLRIQEWREKDHHHHQQTQTTTTTTTTTTVEDSSLSSSSITTTSGSTPMIIESLLLPQELQVLQMIKVKARDRQSRHDFNNCLWALAVTVGIFLFFATCFAIKYMQLELHGPL